MSLKLVIVGAGTIGRIHALAAESTGQFTVAAVVDPNAAVAAEIEHSVGHPIVVASSIAEIADGLVDAAAICTPSGDHLTSADACLSRGWHVLIEKPLDTELAPARAFADRAERASRRGQITSVVSQHRFDPANARLHEMVMSGRLGQITGAVASLAWWRSQSYYDSAAWRGTWAMDGGGAVMNQGIHTVDLLVWLLGEPRSIAAVGSLLAHRDIEVEDTAGAVITFVSGAIATFHATTAAYPGVGTRIMITGDSGSAVLEDDELVFLHTRDAAASEVDAMGGGDNQLEVMKMPPAVEATQSTTGHARQYVDFAAAVRGDHAPGVTVAEAVRSLAMVHALYAAAATGSTVTFTDVLAGHYDGLKPVKSAQP